MASLEVWGQYGKGMPTVRKGIRRPVIWAGFRALRGVQAPVPFPAALVCADGSRSPVRVAVCSDDPRVLHSPIPPVDVRSLELPRLSLQLLCIGVFCRAVLRLRAQEAPHSNQGASDRVASLAGVWARRFPHALFLGSGAEIRHVGWASPALERMALAPCCRESGFRRGSLPPGSRQNDIL